jgi:hypothetical protein
LHFKLNSPFVISDSHRAPATQEGVELKMTDVNVK